MTESILVSEDVCALSLSHTQERKQQEIHRRLQYEKKLQRPEKERRQSKQKKRHGARNQHRHKCFVKWVVEKFDLEQSHSGAPNAISAPEPSSNFNSKLVVSDSAQDNDNNSNLKNRTNPDSHANNNKQRNASSTTQGEDSNYHQTSIFTTALSSQHKKLHILDVAGGKGEVSARLAMCHQQRVVMVDPRPADIVDCYERIVLPKIPKKWQRRLEDQRQNNPEFVRDVVKSRFRQLVTTFDNDIIIYRNEGTDWSSLPSTLGPRPEMTELKDAIQHATLILGLHSDGATEAIIDAALLYRKPFVVVPCCVFPNFFPLRRVLVDQKDGSAPQIIPVRTYEQFCTYLLHKDSRFVMEELPFEGRNIAIWWDGK